MMNLMDKLGINKLMANCERIKKMKEGDKRTELILTLTSCIVNLTGEQVKDCNGKDVNPKYVMEMKDPDVVLLMDSYIEYFQWLKENGK